MFSFRKKTLLSGFFKYFGEPDTMKYTDGKSIYRDFMLQLGGRSFGNGLFHVFEPQKLNLWTEYVTDAFPEYKDRVSLFAYLWSGVILGIDRRTMKVTFFDIGCGETLPLPFGFTEFLDYRLPTAGEVLLEVSTYRQWLERTKEAVPYGSCAGYKRPLYLSGEDTLENRELCNMEVYWGLFGQIYKKVKDSPEGTVFTIS